MINRYERIVELEREFDMIGLGYAKLEANREELGELDYDIELTELNFRYDEVVEKLVRLYKEELNDIERQMDELYEFQDEWDELDFDIEMTDLDIRETRLLRKLKMLTD